MLPKPIRPPVLPTLGLALLVALLAAAPATASAVGIDGHRLVYGAGPGETNDVTILKLHGGDLLISDSGAAMAVTAGCTQIDFHNARCTPDGVDSVVVGLGDGDDSARVENIAAVVYGGPGDDTIRTGAFADVLSGGPGDDTLEAGAGDDRLAGDDEGLADGEPATTQAAGDDRIDGGADDDVVLYRGRDAGVRVDLRGRTGGQAGERDRIEGVESVVGGDGDDELTGDRDDNQLDGGPGDDRLSGRQGNDLLIGGPGRNGVAGGSGNDEIDASGASVRRGACGSGSDAVFALRRSTRIGPDCERAIAGPDPQGGALMDATPSRVDGRFLIFDAACPQAERRCALRLRVRVGGRTVARGGQTLRRGRAWGVRVRLTRAGRALVERGRARTIQVSAGGGSSWRARWSP